MKYLEGIYGKKNKPGEIVWDGYNPLPKKYKFTRDRGYKVYFELGYISLSSIDERRPYIIDDYGGKYYDLRYFMYMDDYCKFKYNIRYGDKVIVKGVTNNIYSQLVGKEFIIEFMYYSNSSDINGLVGVLYAINDQLERYSIIMTNIISYTKNRNNIIDDILM